MWNLIAGSFTNNVLFRSLVSDSLPGDVPDNLPDVELGGNATVAAD
ncbi:hypothetical protein PMV52_04785 [Eggerthella lenta]|nr:hypothetical protein [Eggerthella lenta]MDB1792761.1 hypothetical protein [Eggerthella lenta]